MVWVFGKSWWFQNSLTPLPTTTQTNKGTKRFKNALRLCVCACMCICVCVPRDPVLWRLRWARSRSRPPPSSLRRAVRPRCPAYWRRKEGALWEAGGCKEHTTMGSGSCDPNTSVDRMDRRTNQGQIRKMGRWKLSGGGNQERERVRWKSGNDGEEGLNREKRKREDRESHLQQIHRRIGK